MSAGAGRLGADAGDLGVGDGHSCPTAQGTQALRSRLCLTERVWPHLPLNHTVMQAKPAPLGVTRTLMTRGSAGANLHDKPITTHRLQTAWQPAEGDESGRDGISERCTRTGSCECRRPPRLPVSRTVAELTAGQADGSPGRRRAWPTAGRQHGTPSAQVHFLARHSNVRNLQGNDAPESPLDTYYVCRSMFDVLRLARPRPQAKAHRHESGTRNLRQHSSIDKPTLLNIERGTHDQHRGHARLHRHLDLVATG